MNEDFKILLEKSYNQLPNLLLERIKPFANKTGLEPKNLLREMLKFLILCGKHEESLTPSLAVDEAWHNYILFTKSYAIFCQNNFGKFIHHEPDENEEKNSNRYDRTIELYCDHFGQPPTKIWGEQSLKIFDNSQCGICRT